MKGLQTMDTGQTSPAASEYDRKIRIAMPRVVNKGK